MRTLPLCIAVLAALLLGACAPAATPPAPTELAPTNTVAPPTITPRPPTATATAVPPTATVTAVPPTATEVPPTATLPPTATPEPQPGDVLWDAAEDDCRWSTFAFLEDGAEMEDYPFELRGGNLYLKVDDENTAAYAVCAKNFGEAAVQIDADTVNVEGPNFNNISVVCRYTSSGWYEGALDSGGYWTLWKYSNSDGYEALDQGGSTAIRTQLASNHLTLVCDGDQLSFYINDVHLTTVTDGAFARGQVALSVTTFDIRGSGVRFDSLVVTVPDPANPPGGAVAPTVAPPANPPAGAANCQIVSVQGMVTGNPNLPNYIFLAQGYAPGEPVMVYLTGNFNVQGAVQPITMLQRFDANAQGEVAGLLGYEMDFGPPQGPLTLLFEGTCTMSLSLTWQ